MRCSVLGPLMCGLLAACSVSNTGNPLTASNGPPPEGVTFLRSELARSTTPAVSETELAQFGKDQRKFAFELYGVIGTDSPNLFFSPYSISTALAMTYAGAVGETKAEMAAALSFGLPEPTLHAAFNATDLALAKRASELADNTQGDAFKLSTTNATFVQKDLEVRSAYLDVLAQSYDAGLYLADFAKTPERERVAINSWVLDKTEERIDELLPPMSIDASTELVLVNTIYFKGSWLKKFDAEGTEQLPFHAPTGDKSVAMMHGAATNYVDGEGFQSVQLPYASESLLMLLILPDEGKLADVEARLQSGLFDEARGGSSDWNVDLRLPRFSFSAELKLKEALQGLGMKQAFGAADFSGIAGTPGDLFISDVYHQAFIAVDERGTEAAAATAVVVSRHASLVTVSITFDRPFIFAVYDEPTGEILFAGRLSEP